MTVKDSFPLPIIDDIMHSIGKAKYFGTLDLANGFYQIPVHPDDQAKTAFSCSMRLFEFIRMPFGLCDAPATFQRAMMHALEGLVWKECFVHIDDIIVFGETYEEYMANMQEVLERLAQHGLTINPEKCFFGQRAIRYLGHILSGEGHKIDPDRIIEVETQRGPEAEEQAFLKLKDIISTDRLITHFDPTKPRVLRTDASGLGIGGILLQEGQIVGSKSRALNKAEKRFSAIELECLAILYCIQKFRRFLEGTPFTVVTDHMPLVSMLRRGRETETESRPINKWLMDMVNFDFKFVYKKGNLHTDADAISRHPVGDPPNSEEDDRFGAFSTWTQVGTTMRSVRCQIMESTTTQFRCRKVANVGILVKKRKWK
ncbi:hypothetical protein RvY_03129 [Ramazzottius varieornatus]|uniref:Reverse transcriptase domain-containing protein n=1 Tax=Ramazzottius varieornatus TaxID=947166 RepID=A0A1D1UQR9_RAMVA|nr:hypothetical protein RvY_03129 [Ramazzottius varieornatus]